MTKYIDILDCTDCLELNAELARAILLLSEEAFDRRTHFFHGRYENLYIDVDKLPGLKLILGKGLAKASEILGLSIDEVKFGFWLNIMHKGDVTTLHRHDDNDELLSAVYYVQVNKDSAMFRLHHQDAVEEVIPVAGRFMFFNPALPHEVSEQRSDEPRISIGINFGPMNSNED